MTRPHEDVIREALRYGRPVGMGSNDQALDALAALVDERNRLREALDMLWCYYVLPISDGQKAQVEAALAAGPGTRRRKPAGRTNRRTHDRRWF